jgi:DNA-binding CsgD family transcriptional regulator
MKERFEEGGREIFSLLRQPIELANLTYITELGYRKFLANGYSFGICSSEYWKKEKKSLYYQRIFKDFYSNELLNLKRKQQFISVRVQDSSEVAFLKYISEGGLGNVLAIHRFFDDHIAVYYFLGKKENRDFVNNICNDLAKFEEIIFNYEQDIDKITKDYGMANFSQIVLAPHSLKELFSDNGQKETNQLISRHLLTFKQKEVLSLLASGNTHYKVIAHQMQISVKTVAAHVAILKEKIGVRNKKELVKLARAIIG